MNVIAHQHVCIDVKTISLPIVFQSFQIVVAIGITAKNYLPLIDVRTKTTTASEKVYSLSKGLSYLLVPHSSLT
jgi:hypothetical protein